MEEEADESGYWMELIIEGELLEKMRVQPLLDETNEIVAIHSVINCNYVRHSRESGNPEKHWIPGQARNDKLHKTYVAMYIMVSSRKSALVRR